MQNSSSQIEQYDLVILGSGAAGKLSAWSLAGQGMKTGVIERKYIGGSCPNIAYLPSKNIVHSAKVASYFWRSEGFGISKDNCRINMAGVRERKRMMVQEALELDRIPEHLLIIGGGFVGLEFAQAANADVLLAQIR